MEPPASDKAKETDDCAVVLELSEDDPHYDKKESLLQANGYSPKERVVLKSSSCPNWISDTLKVMLQIARIIHLDEVELYFGEDDAFSPVDFYSPRNEVEALNSILSLLDVSLSTGKCIRVNVLQELREAIVQMIRDFGDKHIVKTTIVESNSLGKEESLLQWGEDHGMRTRLQIVYVEGSGRGAIAKEDLDVGEVALEIPFSIVISEELVRVSDMFPVLEETEGISSETMVLLWSMKEKHNCNSEFKTYFNTLPEKFNTGLSFGVHAMKALGGTLLLQEIIQAKEHLRAQYDLLFPKLCDDHPHVFPRELYTWEQFLWACELWYSNSMKVMFPEGKLRTCLIPIAGFLNHSLYPHILHYGKVDTATNSLKFRLSRPCSAGEECFLSYGNFSSSHLLTFYGFLPQGDNLYDIIPLDIEDTTDEFTESRSTSNTTTHMVRGTWHSNNHNIFYYGLPSPLLDVFRRTQFPMMRSKSLLQTSLENEGEVLENLHSIFDDMMKELDDGDLPDREDSSWDVRLAVEFKDLQKRIVSSLVTSCYAGLKLVENEWCKSMAEDIRGVLLKMMVANSFDLWQKDAFFSAAEEVQESADVMESAYRTWVRERREMQSPDYLDELSRELQTALGTAKWQTHAFMRFNHHQFVTYGIQNNQLLEEFEKAVRLSYGHRSNDNTTARHRQFIAAIEEQISRVEASLRESFSEEGKQSLQWVNLDEDECNELATFLSGTTQSLQSATDECLELRPLMRSSRVENHVQRRDTDLNFNAASDRDFSDERKSIRDDSSSINNNGNHVIKMEGSEVHGRTDDIVCQVDRKTNNARRTWSSPNFGALKIIIPDEDEQINKLVLCIDDTPKEKGSKPVFWKQRYGEFPPGQGAVSFLNQVS
ncbi:SET domain-containing protein 4 [Morella rubra]|uniref:SET domain-containing protein 4 n=1 Tax=Morella rubra TaxID=262757 RepID=A0A6A1UWN5_9ROSI|nr:SET domain-containing protein 4 [Morella rubra]